MLDRVQLDALIEDLTLHREGSNGPRQHNLPRRFNEGNWHDQYRGFMRMGAEILRDAILAVVPPEPELTPIMKESMRLMDEVMTLTYQRDAMERRAEAAEADWQRCETELKSLRAAAPEPPTPESEN
jgi:hypothetical protein